MENNKYSRWQKWDRLLISTSFLLKKKKKKKKEKKEKSKFVKFFIVE